MSLTLAPVLQDVAARVGGRAPEQRLLEPDRWAYALRDAVALARPGWVVTHHDLDLEPRAIAALDVGPQDLLDADLAASPQGAAALALSATLAALYPDGIVAASLTGPVTTVARLAAPVDDLDTAAQDCGDALAALAAEHVARGARRIVVWEPQADAVDPAALAGAHEAMLRRLALLEVESVIAGPVAVRAAGYPRWAAAAGGNGAALLPASAFADRPALTASVAAARAIAGEDGVLLSDGPVPAACDLAALGGISAVTDAGGVP